MAHYVVVKGGTGEIVEKKSRFIANIQPVNSEEEALRFIADMKKKYWDARHNCTAYIVGDSKRYSDDGEPQGTAGLPMLAVLEKKALSNVAVVVTRYFGGILLGTGGLLRAYQGAVNEGLQHCVIVSRCMGMRATIRTDYTGLGKIQYLAVQEQVEIVKTEYGENVSLEIICAKEPYGVFEKKVIEATAGKAVFEKAEETFLYRTESGKYFSDLS